jgi:TolB-like protein
MHGLADAMDLEQLHYFGPFKMDERRGSVSKGDESIFLRPKAYSLLLHLARNAGRVVPKAELMDVVWPGVFVTEDSLTQNIREIRKALSDSGQVLVRTVTRRGYMLADTAVPDLGGGNQPVVAVLRFRNESADTGQWDDSLVDGFADDIINGLARFGSVTVLARASSFAFTSYAQPEWSATAARIGADYIVEGSVRRSGTAAQISVNLIDASKSLQLWGDRYEAEDVGIFAIQREIGEQIVTRLVSRLDEASLRRSAVRPAANLAAYELVIRGAKSLRSFTESPAGEARTLFEEALVRDPDYGLAYAYLALEAVIFGGLGRTPPTVLNEAHRLVAKCIALSPEQSVGHRVMSLVRLYRREHAGAEQDLRLSLRLNPCDADAVEQMGFLMITRGRPLEAIEWIDRAMRLNPLHPHWYDFDRGLAFYVLGEYRKAVEVLQRSHSFLAWTPTLLAACYVQLDERDLAAAAVRKITAANAGFAPLAEAQGGVAFESKVDIDHFVEGVSLALEYAGHDSAASVR